MDHASHVYKGKVALYETRGDMERVPSGAANPNVFSDAVMRLSKAYNDAHPDWQDNGGDIRSGRFSTCLRRLLLAVLPRVGIMAPRQGSPKPRFGCSLHKAVVHHAKAAKRLRRGARRMQSKSAISANLRWSTSGRPWHSARCRTFEGRFRHEQISARYLDHSA